MNHRLENEKVSSLLFSLALPSILAQLATLIYNMVFILVDFPMVVYPLRELVYVHQLLQSLLLLVIFLVEVVLHSPLLN